MTELLARLAAAARSTDAPAAIVAVLGFATRLARVMIPAVVAAAAVVTAAAVAAGQALAGDRAPVFRARAMDGTEVDTAALKGRVVVLNFWFAGCKPCVMEMPELDDLAEDYRDDGVEFIALTRDPEDDVREFLESHPLGYRHVAGAADLIRDLEVPSFPTNVVIDHLGEVTYIKSGWGPDTTNGLRGAVARAVARKKKADKRAAKEAAAATSSPAPSAPAPSNAAPAPAPPAG